MLRSFNDTLATYLWHRLVNITEVNKVEVNALSHLPSAVFPSPTLQLIQASLINDLPHRAIEYKCTVQSLMPDSHRHVCLLDHQIIPDAMAGSYFMLIASILPEAGRTSVTGTLHRKTSNIGQSGVYKS